MNEYGVHSLRCFGRFALPSRNIGTFTTRNSHVRIDNNRSHVADLACHLIEFQYFDTHVQATIDLATKYSSIYCEKLNKLPKSSAIQCIQNYRHKSTSRPQSGSIERGDVMVIDKTQ